MSFLNPPVQCFITPRVKTSLKISFSFRHIRGTGVRGIRFWHQVHANRAKSHKNWNSGLSIVVLKWKLSFSLNPDKMRISKKSVHQLSN